MKQNKLNRIPLIGLACLGLFASPARTLAQTTVLDGTGLSRQTSSFGGDYQSNSFIGVEVVQMASAFTTGSASSTLDSITIDLDTGNRGSGFTVALYSDGGSQPGAFLETLTGNAAPVAGGLVTYTSVGTALQAATTYWWVSSVSPSAGGGAFSVNSTGDTPPLSAQGWTFGQSYQENSTTGGMMGNSSSGWNPDSLSQFSVDATIVPEPSTLALSAMGGLGFGALMMYRRVSARAKRP